MPTLRLYYRDSRLTGFEADVIAVSEDGLTAYLDRTAFYPTSGGQPFDTGLLAGVSVLGVEDEDDGRVAHSLSAPVSCGPAKAEIDWSRRFDHMQQHTGQHLLSAVFVELFGFQTVSFHMGSEVSTIDLACGALTQQQVEAAERRANEIVCENRPVTVSFEDAEAVEGLRKASERTGELRIVSIESLDRSACGGTHVSSTGEIGAVLIRKLDKIRGNVRFEFVCGLRASSRARRDFNALVAISKTFSASIEEAPTLVAAQTARLADADKARRKAVADLAVLQGRALYESTAPAADGLRRALKRGPIDDEVRTLAQSFTAGSHALFLAVCDNPPTVLFAASKDAGMNAGDTMKKALAEFGGRGGGSPRTAQGSVPDAAALAALEQRITADWPKESI